MEIRTCTLEEIEIVADIYKKETVYLESHINYPLWESDIYPVKADVVNAFNDKAQYICIQNDKIIGAFVLDDDKIGDYQDGKWLINCKCGEYLALHRFMVLPEFTGMGYGGKILEWIIQYSKENGYKSIRLDIVPGNIPAIKLYEKMGFKFVFNSNLGRHFDNIPYFMLYEKII